MELVSTQTQDLDKYRDLDDQAKEYISKSKSMNTKKAYQSDWMDFEEWCFQKGEVSLPANPLTVVRYISDRSTNPWTKLIYIGRSKEKTFVTYGPLKPASIDRKLVSISKAHSCAGYEFDKKHPILSEMISGIKKEKGIKQNRKAPILINDLKHMFKELDQNKIGIRDRALLLLGFVGALRRSEIVDLNIEDVKFVKEGIEIFLKRSKTDQFSEGHVIPIPYGCNIETCPVRAIQDWLNISKIESGPLFRSINRHGHISDKRMSAASVAIIIKRHSPDDQKNNVSGHSLRAGFCTQAAINGVSDTQGMRHSRHKKHDSWTRYVRFATVWKESAATKLGI